MKNLSKLILCFLIVTLTFSCSSDDSSDPAVDNRSYILNTNTDYNINMDGTVNIYITGENNNVVLYSNTGEETDQGIVFGTSSLPEVSADNTAFSPSGEFETVLRNLSPGTTYYARGYFEYDNGDSYYYGEEIQFSTDVDASTVREITMFFDPEISYVGTDYVALEIKVSKLTKEAPAELGIEFSVNSDFTDSSTIKAPQYKGVLFTSATGYSILGSILMSVRPVLPNTKYYFRPYAKYADNTVTNGGISTATMTTN
jgi:hypothetical protein